MPRISIILITAWLLIPQLVVAFTALQSTNIDSIITYDFDHKVFNSYPVTMDVTAYGGIIGESSYGTLNTSILDDFGDFLNPDTTILHRVLDHFNAMDYPFSSAAKVQMLRADTLVSRCSGLVISDYWIATASHCSNIRETHFNKWPTDSVTSFFASPAFHNGSHHPTIGPVRIDMAVFFEGPFSGALPDIIFFRLTEPVGKLTGTVKMSASAMQNIPSDSRLLTFGYPGRHFLTARDSSKYGSMYNADTLFFSQNKLREVDPRYIIAHGHANPGQSGSPVLLYQNGQWVSYGVISFGSLDNFRTSYLTELIADNVQHLMDKYDPTNTSIHDEHETPTQVTLNQNYPNPFNSSTTIVYELTDIHHVRLEIIDVLGRTIEVLVDDVQQSGRHVVRFNAQNYPSGVFIYRLHTGNHVETRKMTLIK